MHNTEIEVSHYLTLEALHDDTTRVSEEKSPDSRFMYHAKQTTMQRDVMGDLHKRHLMGEHLCMKPCVFFSVCF